MLTRTFLFLALASLITACGKDEDAAAGDPNGASGDGDACCPRDTAQSGSMRLGGPAASGCFVTHDFWCSANWRVERDEHGCEVWRYDVRAPGPDETSFCMAKPKPVDAGAD